MKQKNKNKKSQRKNTKIASQEKAVEKSSHSPMLDPAQAEQLSRMPLNATNQLLQQKSFLQLQKIYGNSYVQRHFGHDHEEAETVQRQEEAVTELNGDARIQRVPIQATGFSETLLQGYDNNNVATQDYRPHTYGGSDTEYEMTRTDSDVTVDVRIKFVKRINWGDTDEEIPEGSTRDFGRQQCRDLVAFWNNKFELVGTCTPEEGLMAQGMRALGMNDESPPQPYQVDLPLKFTATPVFDLDADAHKTVALHDEVTADGTALASNQPTVAGEPRSRRIDAGNWFVTKDDDVYPASYESIYAHEYGHLLGIPDEYSLSNPTMHALFHDISPQSEDQMNQQLDTAGIRQMVLAALNRPLQPLLLNASDEIAQAFQTQQKAISKQMAKGLRDSWRDQSLIDFLVSLMRPQFEAAGQERALAALPEALRFEAFDNLSNLTLADQAVTASLQPSSIRQIMAASYTAAFDGAQQGTVEIPYINDLGNEEDVEVSIDVAPVISGASSPLATAAASAAQQLAGEPMAGPMPEGSPMTQLYPSNSIIGQIGDLPTAWANVENLMQNEIDTMQDNIWALVDETLQSVDLTTNVNDNVRSLYRVLYDLVQGVSTSVIQMSVDAFLSDEMRPLIEGQINGLMTKIEAEADRHQTVQGTGTNASSSASPDPQLDAVVRQLEQQARQLINQAPAADGTPSAQNIRFTVHALMGANSQGESVRVDQMRRIADNFNGRSPELRHDDESNFRVRSTQ